ncbi:MAG: epoxyqueuosine reductase QueH [Candidatus Gracilibacteria bacterium]|nr:epoxyqueuosine reductase QueH [Candidatus Gracilibacteria bacterium]
MKLLLHTCCAPCSAYVEQVLRPNFEVSLYYFNPNIHPKAEYQTRLAELKKYAAKYEINFIEAAYQPETWFAYIKGYEEEPEGGERCRLCYRMRLEATAKYAKENGFEHFTSTLSISPHKKSAWINEIGKELAEKYALNFLEADFKKQDGFKKSCEVSKEEGFYRQTYCGCVYSQRD